MSNRSPLFFLLVGDPFLRQRKIEFLIKKLIPSEKHLYEILKIDLKETSLDSLIGQARSFSMMAEKQIFLVREPKELKKDDCERLEAYMKKPADWSYLLFEADQLDERHGLQALMKKYGEKIVCDMNDKRRDLDLLHQKIKQENRQMTREAWQLLEERTGGHLTLMDACIEKLLIYVSEKDVIDAPAVLQLSDKLLAYDTFDLTNAIAEKNPKKALEVFEYLYQLEGSGIGVIGLINWQLKRLWQAKVIAKEKGERAVGQNLRISPYRLSGFLRQMASFQLTELEHAFDELFDLDWKLKTGTLNGRIALEAFIVSLASPRQRTPALSV
ncbi:MAG: DNA polymerase III subunit delta [Candidatus Omnitrophica bacterium CG11_big_fil_rev_8_21_14_0_20_45_26]|uniref:DNA polymerase III subunit delta n=1 Tax=Candidatus Abzuiibacterium crystallinum TaxID=1974748 RepID=A0A2H0LL63_9BACT|nr:MAG: DNA polymerase III subunit delta [Candidatus Omnitrophica bacterium CG11_big_fil_rev_8_21_14_0_20_45_26]PIW63797.1 MAG: DNA polymerase III subunit delta [Candidatus Omnitrophica bacterium CG12_big_fil_rev_8_21_14_0_65_45_16]